MGIFKTHTKHSNSPANTQITELEEKLNIRKALQNITNRINAAQNLKNILIDLREDILSLFDAKSVTIYVKDQSSNEIYSMFLAGSKLSEIRVPITNQSIAGYATNNMKVVNITDAYDSEELKNIDAELSFDSSWDIKSGIKTTQVMAVPIPHEGKVMGVIQILNKENGDQKFSDDDEVFLKEIADVLGIAFFNHERIKKKKRSRFDYLMRYGLISAETLEEAYGKSHDNRETIEDYLMKTFKISKEDIGKSLAEFYGCEFVQFSDKAPTPFDLLKNLKEDYLRREMWVPLERKDGKVRIIIDDPNNVLKRDMIENLLKTRAVVYDIALYSDIKKYINFFYQTDEVSGSISDIIGQLD
ncbi:MAG: GAF domain-containing protein, partial [Thermodesulfobacteriota bacterium]|nr:GAF domain-containing protein [Thermodesulfobacteriota bacterium]